MAAKPIHILLVEDNQEDIRMIWNMLHEKSPFQFTVEAVTGIADALERLKVQDIHVVLLDLSLVSYQAETDAVQAILKIRPQLALIVLTELENEQEALRALASGAQNYLIKKEIGSHALVRALYYAVEQGRVEAALRTAEERNLEILESITESFYAVDTDWRLTYINRQAEQFWNRRRENLLGTRLWDMFPNYEQTVGYQQHQRAMQERIPVHWETYSPNLKVWVNVHAYPIANGGLSVYFEDITQRKATENALRTAEEQYRSLVTATSDTVYKMSPDWREMRYLEGKNFIPSLNSPNHSWLEIYIPAEDRPQVMAVIQEAIRNKQVFELEHRVIQVDGTLGWTFSRAIPLLDEQGEIREWLGTASNVSHRKRAEEELKTAKEYNEAIVNAIRDGILVLEPDLRVQFANTSFLRMFDVGVEETIGVLIYQLGNGQWNIPKLRQLLEAILSVEYPDGLPSRA